MAAAAAVFSVAIGEHSAAHHLLDICLYVLIYKIRVEAFELLPMVTEYLDEPVFVINGAII